MPRDVDMADQEYEYMQNKENAVNLKVLKAVTLMYLKSLKLAKEYHEDTKHKLYFSPVSFIRTFKTFSRLLEERRKNVIEI
jgi:hypothetical protein